LVYIFLKNIFLVFIDNLHYVTIIRAGSGCIGRSTRTLGERENSRFIVIT
jgi:hypothetical protein